MSARRAGFRARLHAREKLIGAFVKTPAISTVEILGGTGLDFVVIDQEHAPLDRAAIDGLIPAARWSGLAPLVRVSGPVQDNILSALDGGAAGVLVPHVNSAARASEVARACHYGPGGRGFSGSVRAAGYGAAKLGDHLADCAENVTLIAQIEDGEALGEVDAIAATEGVDAVFLGLGDLTVSLGETDVTAPAVQRAAERIAAAARKAGKPACAMAASRAAAEPLLALGVSAFIIGTDQGFLGNGAKLAVTDFADLRTSSMERRA